MAQVEKTVLVMHSCEAMFQLVDAVETYADFLPWCGGSQVIERTDTVTQATIHIRYHGIQQHFTTRNHKQFPHRMEITLVDGPFKQLSGHWHFIRLREDACKIEFKLEYVFANGLIERMIAPVFSHIANTFVDSFVKQAGKLQLK
ncbi:MULTISPECIES: type II toxin-antitoxin system RatA family toxin [unclassified Methylophilus]|jgi:ribosome-associated toxin RatA of RatAB toxin-antitoxin module|uniref:Type II toxin-antitoxin system RatA family toxin n=1 Tax=Methylophilus glucosoxydans TaxID=752553 RepID=A0ABW3GH28_9PROT|nr:MULTISPECIES: type II toxin-antitoxin system RatA family toxin [unclassified Methylophilus]MBF5038901.1 type II toxin-antitoxin system RatA family toxin [Methylophilus sp. 13]MDF0377075.1 ubiquinone-binding protein [Methylophilus sp. YYY-1]MDT7850140.1 type II toxin-antitoxin system RatA family toxin [Methylophilus sp. VKM B-3414]BEV08353.1 type II toxin-antitoxin system RatA family toxin [Methylophilus sp. DW102]